MSPPVDSETPDLPFPLTGSTLVTGPANVGKTRLTARALDAWVAEHGAEGVVVLDFAPELERDGRLLGGRLTRFTAVPDGAWHAELDAHAPRAEGADADEAADLAADNARRALDALDRAPDPVAAFVNDATIPFQAAGTDPGRLTRYCDPAEAAVLNAFAGDELGVDDPVSRRERAAIRTFEAWATRHVELAEEG